MKNGSVTIDRLHAFIPPRELIDWEEEELLEQLARHGAGMQETLLQHIRAIWPVSTALCFTFLEEVEKALRCLDNSQLGDWVKEILDIYEAEGLQAARTYIYDVENNFLCQVRGESGLLFAEAESRLLPYIRGLAGHNMQLHTAPQVSTDTETIFLPRQIDTMSDKRGNFLVYKLIASYQWAFLENDLYWQQTGKDDALMQFLATFPDPQRAGEVYHLVQTVQATVLLQKKLPGLMADAQIVFQQLLDKMAVKSMPGDEGALDKARKWLLSVAAGRKHGVAGELMEIFSPMFDLACPAESVSGVTAKLYDAVCVGEQQSADESLLFQGELRVDDAMRARLRRRQANKQHFIEALALVLPPTNSAEEQNVGEGEEKDGPKTANAMESGATITAASPSEHEDRQEQPAVDDLRYICVDDERFELSEELRQLAREIVDDLGSLPLYYISSASQMAGSQGKSPARAAESPRGAALQGDNLYDEWDFRRQGFRKNWCRIIERKISPVKGTFVSSTLEKYRGQIMQMRRQFEMMRTQHRFLRRQKDGDDIDVDALIEAIADQQAGRVPSERLFVRLQRDERDIVALFLVDMSSSTEGWVGTAIKEALLLLSESLDALGDRYAIYGFSGMRRSRSEIFHIKDFEESYSEEIKNRIAAISPMDYTRMGAPIRFFSSKLQEVEARVRMLVILTDGKPEDYDDYKGEYAIEDTRHALVEAKSCGIHPFCITIDKEAQEYMAHMFGAINYTFIDDVKKLPLRVPEIYRMLTSA